MERRMQRFGVTVFMMQSCQVKMVLKESQDTLSTFYRIVFSSIFGHEVIINVVILHFVTSYSTFIDIILQSVELTGEAVEFLNGIFRLLDTDKVCTNDFYYHFLHHTMHFNPGSILVLLLDGILHLTCS
jgi:hypothetical protein